MNIYGKNMSYWIILTAVLIIAVASRFVLLNGSEAIMDADECVVGIMAMHINNGESIPLFFYGQHYGGGHVLEALIAAGLFRITGTVSGMYVQMVPALFSIFLLLLIFEWTYRSGGLAKAAAAALFLIISAPYMRISFKVNGYVETVFIGLYALYIIESIISDKTGKLRGLKYFAASALLGLAYWSFDFGLVYAMAAFVIVVLKGRQEMNLKYIPVIAGGFATGCSLLIYDNIVHDFANLRHLLTGSSGEGTMLTRSAANFINLTTHDLPAYFTPESIHNFMQTPPLTGYITAAILTCGFLYSSIWRKRSRMPLSFVLAAAAYLFLYVISSFASISPRYLMPAGVFMAAAAGIAAVDLISMRKPLPVALAIICAICVTAISLGDLRAISRDFDVVEGNVRTSPESLDRVIVLLREQDIDCVNTTYFIKWRILFNTREQINAVDILSPMKKDMYSRYEDKGCNSIKHTAFVFHKDSPYVRVVAGDMFRQNMSLRVTRTTDHIIMKPIPRRP